MIHAAIGCISVSMRILFPVPMWIPKIVLKEIHFKNNVPLLSDLKNSLAKVLQMQAGSVRKTIGAQSLGVNKTPSLQGSDPFREQQCSTGKECKEEVKITSTLHSFTCWGQWRSHLPKTEAVQSSWRMNVCGCPLPHQ